MKITKQLLICLTLSLSCLLSSSCLASVENSNTLRTVALSGNTAPGTPAGVNFSNFGKPVLNDASETAFRVFLTGPGVLFRNNQSIWSEGGGGRLDQIAREDNTAPDPQTGDNFSSFENPLLSGTGQTAFLGLTKDIDSTIRGIWSEGGGSGLALVARAENTAPGTPTGVNFSNINSLVLNDAGQTAFFAFLTGTGVSITNNTGIWSEGGGRGLALVARKGNRAPDTPADVFFSNFGSPVLNMEGQVAFMGELGGSGVNDSNDEGIWSGVGGVGLALVARSGNAVPGTLVGVNFSSFGNPALNSTGQTAFKVSLTGSEVSVINNSSIWSEGGGSLALVVREGHGAPGTNRNFSSFLDPVLNDRGQTAFIGTITGSVLSNSGIWSEGEGSLTLVAREGDLAAGTNGNFSSFIDPVLNDRGQTAFLGNLTGGNSGQGIWAQGPSGVLTLIAREGDLLDVDDGPGTDFRTIRSLSFVGNTGNGDGRPSGFNNLGQLVFEAKFTDGTSGIFVSNLAAIPEPATWALAAFAAIGLAVRRRAGKRS